MTFDGVAVLLVAARRRARLDDIWVESALNQELRLWQAFLHQGICKVLEVFYELRPYCLPFLLWICDALHKSFSLDVEISDLSHPQTAQESDPSIHPIQIGSLILLNG